jgi:hypothetical protein
MEGSITFCQKNVLEVPWGLFKEMHTNTQGQSDIVTQKTNICNKVSTMPKGLLFLLILPFNYHGIMPRISCINTFLSV